MLDNIHYYKKNDHYYLTLIENKLAIYYGKTYSNMCECVASFDLESVWDMLRDYLAIMNVGPLNNPSLFRRKGEAATAIQFICTFMSNNK